jgi:hypothetical protein
VVEKKLKISPLLVSVLKLKINILTSLGLSGGSV